MPLLLPQAQVSYKSEPTGGGSPVHLLVLGGRAPEPNWLRSAASDKIVWAVDRGADVCMSAGITPHHVLGDFDSISKEGETWLRRLGPEVEIERYTTDKDYTDFQLCLKRVKGYLLVTGCWGGRFDHAFANVFSALWGLEWGAGVVAFADESEVLIPLSSKEQQGAALELRLLSKVSAISLLPLCESCEGVDIRGTKWELSGATLAQGRPYAVSNVPTGEKVSVKIESGIIGVYCFFEREASSGG